MRAVFALLVLAGSLVLALPAAAQDPPAAPPGAPSPVLPAEHPLRPQAPPRPDRSHGEELLGFVGAVLRGPFELLGKGVLMGAQRLESQCGSFSAGLSARSSQACAPKHYQLTFGSIGTRSGMWGLGLGAHNELINPRGLKFGATAKATYRLYQRYEAYAGWNDPDTLPAFRITGFYDLDTMDEFWGLGPDASEHHRSDFAWETYGARAVASLPERTGVWGTLQLGYEKSFVFGGRQHEHIDTVDRFPGTQVPRQEFLVPGATVVLDWRDAPGHPTRGVLLQASAERYQSLNDLDLNWLTYGGHGQVHFPLGSEWHILSAKVEAQRSEPDDESEIPFQYLPRLGGSDHLRGYNSWRWRDRAAAFGAVEYRYRIWQEQSQNPETAAVLETAIFLEGGNVGHDFDDLELGFGDLKTSYGFEIHAFFKDSHVFRMGLGRSEEGLRINFSLDDYWTALP
ncbi:MAG: BamA/TamA family outer membrane protein [Gemmatimonadota bacterium]